MITPADELAAAADKLRRVCAAASPGPWTIAEVPPYTDPLLLSRYEETPDDEDVLIVGNVDLEPEDRAVVQLLHPGVGAALAESLDSAAKLAVSYPDLARDHDRKACDDYACDVMGRSIALARQINGSAR